MSTRISFVAVALSLALAGPALAKGEKKPAKPTAKQPKVEDATPRPANADAKAVAELMGPYKWGMSLDEMLGALEKTIADQYAEQIAKTTDVYEQTRLRKEVKAQVAQVKKTLVLFDGKQTGWDVSLIEGEFLQRNDESMVIYREIDPVTKHDQQRFFFFYKGKLWKIFIAFDMEPYKGKTFDDFRGVLETRYGKGAPQKKVFPDGKERLASVYWRAGSTDLRAVDLTVFYNNFCISLSDENVEKQTAPLRAAEAAKHRPRGALIDSGSTDPVHDPNADIVDKITAGENKPAEEDTLK